MPPSDERREWRRSAEDFVKGYGNPVGDTDSHRILALLDALDSAEDRALRFAKRLADIAAEDDSARLAVARLRLLLAKWDALSKGETMTTSAIRAALSAGGR